LHHTAGLHVQTGQVNEKRGNRARRTRPVVPEFTLWVTAQVDVFPRPCSWCQRHGCAENRRCRRDHRLRDRPAAHRRPGARQAIDCHARHADCRWRDRSGESAVQLAGIDIAFVVGIRQGAMMRLESRGGVLWGRMPARRLGLALGWGRAGRPRRHRPGAGDPGDRAADDVGRADRDPQCRARLARGPGAAREITRHPGHVEYPRRPGRHRAVRTTSQLRRIRISEDGGHAEDHRYRHRRG
jgi:hypothetical protein